MSFMIFAHVLRLLLVNPGCLLIQSAMIDSDTPIKINAVFQVAPGQFPTDNPWPVSSPAASATHQGATRQTSSFM